MNQLLLAVILSILPISELRGGLPIAINYALTNNLSILPIFLLIVFTNVIVIFLIFFFLDFFHDSLMKIELYEKVFNFYISKIRKKVEGFEKSYSIYGFLALTIFVAVPLPGTGAWTGTIIAWILGLERKKSILAISLGVLIAGFLVLLASLGFFSLIR